LTLNGNRFIASHGNQNTKIGLALNMLRMQPSHQMAIFEVGISRRGEMAELSKMLQPTTAVITNIGHCHMEGLGSLQDIALEKRDIFKSFTQDSIGIINGDNPLLANVGYVHPVLKFGVKMINQVQARKIHKNDQQITFVLKLYKKKYPITFNHVHEGIVMNSLAAAAVAHLLGVPDTVIVQAIATPVVVPGRFEKRVLKNGKGIMIHDCYNANPESMRASLLAFQKIETKAQKIAVLGDMLELGVNSAFWHRQLGRFLRKVPSVKRVILVGSMVSWAKKTLPFGVQADIVPTWQEAQQKLQEIVTEDACVLVKGSLGTGLRHLVHEVSLPINE
jgi:UDP-N-acetylmuramoyl-tripeptide--D-alanyl-D-alanine ligase